MWVLFLSRRCECAGCVVPLLIIGFVVYCAAVALSNRLLCVGVRAVACMCGCEGGACVSIERWVGEKPRVRRRRWLLLLLLPRAAGLLVLLLLLLLLLLVITRCYWDVCCGGWWGCCDSNGPRGSVPRGVLLAAANVGAGRVKAFMWQRTRAPSSREVGFTLRWGVGLLLPRRHFEGGGSRGRESGTIPADHGPPGAWN